MAAERIGLNLDSPSDDEANEASRKADDPAPVKEKERLVYADVQ